MPKTALVISGGGSKGAFAVGVLKAIFQHAPNLYFDMMIGTSTGSLIAPLATPKSIALLEHLYTSIKTENIITTYNIGNRVLTANSIFGVAPLANQIAQYFTDAFFQDLTAQPYTVVLTTTCLQTIETAYFTSNKLAFPTAFHVTTLNEPDNFRRAILASACQPVFMPPIEVMPGTVPLRQYVDGGVRQYAAIQIAIEQGAEEIFAILLSSGQNVPAEKNFNNIPDILMRTVDAFTEDVGENDVAAPEMYNEILGYIAAIKQNMQQNGIQDDTINQILSVPNNPFTNKKSINLHIIRPTDYLGGGPGGLTFDPVEMQGMLQKGFDLMNNYIATLAIGSSVLT